MAQQSQLFPPENKDGFLLKSFLLTQAEPQKTNGERKKTNMTKA
jgi:hypothetical protein